MKVADLTFTFGFHGVEMRQLTLTVSSVESRTGFSLQVSGRLNHDAYLVSKINMRNQLSFIYNFLNLFNNFQIFEKKILSFYKQIKMSSVVWENPKWELFEVKETFKRQLWKKKPQEEKEQGKNNVGCNLWVHSHGMAENLQLNEIFQFNQGRVVVELKIVRIW